MTFKPLDEMRAVRNLGLPTGEKIVLFALILRAGDHGECWPSLETIAQDAGLTSRWVKTLIAKLAKDGRITVTRRRAEGRTTSNLYRVISLHPGVISLPPVQSDLTSPPGVISLPPRGDLTSHEMLTEMPTRTAQFALARSEGDPERASKGKKRKAPKHSPEEIAAKELILTAFIQIFEAAKGVKPKILDAPEHVAAFKLVAYGVEEATSIIKRAFQDPFVADKNASLKFIAPRAESYRGNTAPVKANGRMVQPGPADGEVAGWKLRQEARRRAAGEPS